MIAPGPGVRIWLAAGLTDMRRGFDGLAALVQQQLGKDPFICVGRGYVAARSGEPTNSRRRRTSPLHNISSFLPRGSGSPWCAREEKMLCWIAISNTLVC